MRKAILWDNDGVLVDTERLFFRANRALFAAHGLTLAEREFFDWFLLDNCGGWHLFRERGHTDASIAEIRKERNALFTALLHAQEALARDGMEDVVRSLAPFLPMAVVTSASREHFLLAHRNTAFQEFLRFVITDEDCATSKPSPEPYLLGAKRLGLSPEQCVAVEDSPRGLAAARAAGMTCIVVRSELTAGYPFEGAFAVVESNAELLGALAAAGLPTPHHARTAHGVER
jgi:HAD superfamily hydrolase (TIGR01509 family)